MLLFCCFSSTVTLKSLFYDSYWGSPRSLNNSLSKTAIFWGNCHIFCSVVVKEDVCNLDRIDLVVTRLLKHGKILILFIASSPKFNTWLIFWLMIFFEINKEIRIKMTSLYDNIISDLIEYVCGFVLNHLYNIWIGALFCPVFCGLTASAVKLAKNRQRQILSEYLTTARWRGKTITDRTE